MPDLSLPLFQALYQHLPDAVFLIDFDTARIVDGNGAAVRQSG